MSFTDDSNQQWIALLESFAKSTGLSLAESGELLIEFERDVDQARIHLESRYRPAAAEWDAIQERFGFQQPFPVRIALPRGNRVYHKVRSLTLARQGNKIRLHCSTQFLGKPGSWNDNATCSFVHDFEHFPDLKTLSDIFDHWVRPQRDLHAERLATTPTRSHLEDEHFFRNPDSWTLQDFVNNKGATLCRSGKGTTVRLNIGCLGYAGASSSIYLLSSGGVAGTIVTQDGWPLVTFDVKGFVIGEPGDFPELPVLDESPFEFATTNQ